MGINIDYTNGEDEGVKASSREHMEAAENIEVPPPVDPNAQILQLEC